MSLRVKNGRPLKKKREKEKKMGVLVVNGPNLNLTRLHPD